MAPGQRFYDPFIIEYLRKGYLNREDFQSTLASLNKREREKQTEQKLHAVWKKYHINFRATANEVLSGFRDFVQANHSDLRFGELVQICDFVTQLGHPAIAQEWMDDCIKSHVPGATLEAIEVFRPHTKNPEILALMAAKTKVLKEQFALKPIVYRIAEQSSWGPKDETILNSFSEDAYYDWLKSETDEEIITNLRNFHKIFNSKSSSEGCALVGRKLEGALLRLAKDDPLHRVRARNFFGLIVPADHAGGQPGE